MEDKKINRRYLYVGVVNNPIHPVRYEIVRKASDLETHTLNKKIKETEKGDNIKKYDWYKHFSLDIFMAESKKILNNSYIITDVIPLNYFLKINHLELPKELSSGIMSEINWLYVESFINMEMRKREPLQNEKD